MGGTFQKERKSVYWLRKIEILVEYILLQIIEYPLHPYSSDICMLYIKLNIRIYVASTLIMNNKQPLFRDVVNPPRVMHQERMVEVPLCVDRLLCHYWRHHKEVHGEANRGKSYPS